MLLDVPRYEFHWQHRYVLAEPRRIPAGTAVRLTAVFDNSANNPNNPDPSAVVRYGDQTTDEMFQGYLELAPDDPAPSHGAALTVLFGAVFGIMALFWRPLWRLLNRQPAAAAPETSSWLGRSGAAQAGGHNLG